MGSTAGINLTSKCTCCLRVSSSAPREIHAASRAIVNHTYAADRSHDPPTRIVIENHGACLQVYTLGNDVVMPSSLSLSRVGDSTRKCKGDQIVLESGRQADKR